jgi:hypothetical protein
MMGQWDMNSMRKERGTLKVQAWPRFWHRLQQSDPSSVLLRAEASHATRRRRHSSQLENWVLRVPEPPRILSVGVVFR